MQDDPLWRVLPWPVVRPDLDPAMRLAEGTAAVLAPADRRDAAFAAANFDLTFRGHGGSVVPLYP